MEEYIEEYDTIKIDGNEYEIYVGDFIKKIEINENIITFEYVIGGHYYINENKNDEFVYLPETGIEYVESYKYNGIQKKKIMLEGKEIDLFYEDVDYSTNLMTVYNKDYNLTREANISTIKNMKVGDIWDEEDACTCKVFKDDVLMGLSETPKYEINVEVDRGAASVNERFFKLGECNTFEDLENYGNDYFGLNN